MTTSPKQLAGRIAARIRGSVGSTKRALRTVFHGVVALIGAVPTIVLITHLTHLDTQHQVSAALASLVLWTGAASKIINQLEDAGVLPAWLKD
jgi:hypothetical protein